MSMSASELDRANRGFSTPSILILRLVTSLPTTLNLHYIAPNSRATSYPGYPSVRSFPNIYDSPILTDLHSLCAPHKPNPFLHLFPLIPHPRPNNRRLTQNALRHHNRKDNKRTGYINGWLTTSWSSSRTTQRHPEVGHSTRTPSSESRSDLKSAVGHAY
jgi:hypothetical protein